MRVDEVAGKIWQGLPRGVPVFRDTSSAASSVGVGRLVVVAHGTQCNFPGADVAPRVPKQMAGEGEPAGGDGARATTAAAAAGGGSGGGGGAPRRRCHEHGGRHRARSAVRALRTGPHVALQYSRACSSVCSDSP